MKNILVNPKLLINKKRQEINDVIDHRLINWLLSNSYNPIIISNTVSKNLQRKKLGLLKKMNIKGIIL